MKRFIKQIFQKAGFDLVRIKTGRIGQDPLDDMAYFLRDDRPVIFDVGANVGQSVEKFRSRLPNCTIHSFEPSPSTFSTLKRKVGNLDRVNLWNCALGSVPGQAPFLENSHSDMSSFLPLGETGWGKITKETMVEVRTIDQFCRDHRIDKIDILKSDTQGFDLEVFRGAEETLRSNPIGMIYFEVTFSDIYKNLPPFGQMFDFLTSRDYSLVTFYQFHYQYHVAGWTDALFVHKSYRKESA